MRSTKTFNNISKELLQKIPRLKPREVVTFQMLNGVPNPEPDERERSRNPILYGKVQINTNFRIYDEYANGGQGGYVDVGCVDQWNGDDPVRFRFFVPGMGEFSHFQGKFQLQGGNVKDEELYEILWLSPQREGSPCKDEGVTPLFRILDLKGESTGKLKKVEMLRKAIEIAGKISEKKAKAVLAALNQSSYQDKEVVMAKIAELASTDPEGFLNTYNDEATDVKGVVREAIEANIISHDVATGEVKVGKSTLTTLKVVTADDFTAEFSQFLLTSENGKDILKNIEKQLDAIKPAST